MTRATTRLVRGRKRGACRQVTCSLPPAPLKASPSRCFHSCALYALLGFASPRSHAMRWT